MLWDTIEGCSVCECSSNSVFNSGRCCNYNGVFDKENMQECLDNLKQGNEENDLSLYENSSPISSACDGSPTHCLHQQHKRGRPLEDLDNNSQDSGYEADGNKFHSPKKSFHSHGSTTDDDFFDICGLEDDDENAQLPGDFNKLISGSLLDNLIDKKSPARFVRPAYRHSVSLKETTASNINRIRSCLFKKDDEVKCFKRPEPPTEIQSPKSTKRSKNDIVSFKPRPLMRSISLPANEDSIKSALQRSTDEPDLIGDFSKQFCLPLTVGKHPDLKSISSSTLALLLKGHFQHSVANFKIIDCRYPYEYNGGHIHGALNLYSKEKIIDGLFNSKIKQQSEGRAQDEDKRDILIFHCEFSSERGPNLFRFLRRIDRNHNNTVYPYLHYPEIYLLDGGYKDFYQQYSELCVPEAYLPMLHPSYEHDLKLYRTKSKTLNVDTHKKSNSRSLSFKRL